MTSRGLSKNADRVVVGLLAPVSYRKDFSAARCSAAKSSGREVPALVDLVEVDQVAMSAPGPCFRGSIDLLRKYRDGHRERNLVGLLKAASAAGESVSASPAIDREQFPCRATGSRARDYRRSLPGDESNLIKSIPAYYGIAARGADMAGDVYNRFCVTAVQAAPVFVNRDASIARLEQWVAKAKSAGADLVVFGESYIPAFPLWDMLYAPIDQHAFYRRLYDNAIQVPSPQVEQLAEIA
jgi:Carbon-nitrogen hydrolase